MTQKIDSNIGLLLGARQVHSPNCDERPEGVEIDLIVIHNISLPPGKFGGGEIDAFFTNQLDPSAHPYFKTMAHLTVSSHVVIDRQGEITQYVPFTKRAWHAGVSVFEGREKCNDFSIGIELEGTDTLPYTEQQYQSLIALIKLLRVAYPGITPDRITGHSDIAPSRKTDPGDVFDWARLSDV